VPDVLSRFAPPIALMGLIYFLSSRPHLSSGLGDWDLILRKGAHMTEYAALATLWWRALGTPEIGFAIAIAYACTDEFHQSFVEGRHGAPIDVGIDAIGAAIGIALVRASRARWR
jgi:VanZ family protein